MSYIVLINNEENGPYSIENLIEYVNDGSIKPDTMARHSDSGEWWEVSAIIYVNQKKNPALKQKSLLGQIGSQSKFSSSPPPSATQTGKTLQDYDREENTSPDAPSENDLHIKPVEAPWFINLQYVIGIFMLAVGTLFFMIAIGAPVKDKINFFIGAISGISGGVSLCITATLMSWLHECMQRLRNIESNTAATNRSSAIS